MIIMNFHLLIKDTCEILSERWRSYKADGRTLWNGSVLKPTTESAEIFRSVRRPIEIDTAHQFNLNRREITNTYDLDRRQITDSFRETQALQLGPNWVDTISHAHSAHTVQVDDLTKCDRFLLISLFCWY